jgi:hypothetical protein
MALSPTFHKATNGGAAASPAGGAKRRPAPFSLRLTLAERERLLTEAKGTPLGAYIKTKALGAPIPARLRQSGLAVEDRQALGQALALLGASRLSSNLNQLAHLAHIGVLPVTLELQDELSAALADIRSVRALLITALGLKAQDGAP